MRSVNKLLIVFLLVVLFLLLFSPFKKSNGQYALENEIIINGPISEIYTYLGNSGNAAQWSAYVDHITPLNPAKVKDGKKGSIRRSFKNEDEEGIWWDEEILTDNTNTERELTIYNMHGFAIQTHNLTTKQLYTAISDTATQLTFGLYKNAEEVTFSDWFKMRFAGWVISSIFDKNLEGIKREVEKT